MARLQTPGAVDLRTDFLNIYTSVNPRARTHGVNVERALGNRHLPLRAAFSITFSSALLPSGFFERSGASKWLPIEDSQASVASKWWPIEDSRAKLASTWLPIEDSRAKVASKWQSNERKWLRAYVLPAFLRVLWPQSGSRISASGCRMSAIGSEPIRAVRVRLCAWSV